VALQQREGVEEGRGRGGRRGKVKDQLLSVCLGSSKSLTVTLREVPQKHPHVQSHACMSREPLAPERWRDSKA
jgi:hypothetical protein